MQRAVVMRLENKIRILIIDDEPQMRRMLKIALVAHGYEIREAANGQEGIERAAVFKTDIVLLDLTLPDMDGLEVIRNLREWSYVPVIVLSVREHEDDKIAALDAGADDYITKPFRMGELLARHQGRPSPYRQPSGRSSEPGIWQSGYRLLPPEGHCWGVGNQTDAYGIRIVKSAGHQCRVYSHAPATDENCLGAIPRV